MDTVSPERRSEIMRRVRSKDSAAELAVRRLVHGLGYRYRLHGKGLAGHPDLVFAGRRKVIFVHSCFWHQHLGCARARVPSSNQDYWVAKLARNVARDKAVARKLRADGWGVLTIWECRLANSCSLAKRVRRFLDG